MFFCFVFIVVLLLLVLCLCVGLLLFFWGGFCLFYIIVDVWQNFQLRAGEGGCKSLQLFVFCCVVSFTLS